MSDDKRPAKKKVTKAAAPKGAKVSARKAAKKAPAKKTAKKATTKKAAKKAAVGTPKVGAKKAAAKKAAAKKTTKKVAAKKAPAKKATAKKAPAKKASKSQPPKDASTTQALVAEAAASEKKAQQKPEIEARNVEPAAVETKGGKTSAAVKQASIEVPVVKEAAQPVATKSDAPETDPLHTRICDLFGIDYPIIQTGMGWVSGANLTAATSKAGGLGILAAATMTFDELKGAIGKVRSRTDNPFGVNMRADQADIMDRVDLIIGEGVKVASFAQAPNKKVIERLKNAGVIVMPTIGAQRHAEKVTQWGVDAVIAQGHEGGGHTGVVPTGLLLQQVRQVTDLPVLGAGGFSSGQGLVAALAYGADGIAMGTRFLLTQESRVPNHIKAEYLKAKVNQTVVTKAIDGHPQRVIRTKMIDALENAGPLLRVPLAMQNAITLAKLTDTKLADMAKEGLAMREAQDLTWSQLAMAANAPMLTKASMVDGRLEAGILPTGQVAGAIDDLPTVEELIQRIMIEARSTLTRLGQ